MHYLQRHVVSAQWRGRCHPGQLQVVVWYQTACITCGGMWFPPNGRTEGVPVPAQVAQAWNAAPEAINASTSSIPQASSASRVLEPTAEGPVLSVASVREKRGAGAGWSS